MGFIVILIMYRADINNPVTASTIRLLKHISSARFHLYLYGAWSVRGAQNLNKLSNEKCFIIHFWFYSLIVATVRCIPLVHAGRSKGVTACVNLIVQLKF